MSAPSSVSSKRKRIAPSAILPSLFCACAAFGAAQGQSPSSQSDTSIPNFSPSSTVGWLKAGVGDEFLSPDTGTVTADQTTKTTAQLAIDQFDGCAGSLFKDEFDPAEVDYELSLNKEAVLFLSAQWRSHDGAINIMTRIRSIGSTVIREMTMTQNGASNDELPQPAAKVKEHIAKVFEECPPEKEDIECADAVTERFNGIEQVVRHNLEYPDVAVEKYTSNEQIFRASKQVQRGVDDYSLVLNGATDHKSFGWRTFRPFTPAAVEEVLHNPPARIAKNGRDIRKLQTCMENVVPQLRIIPR
jgi:hypothetical protein